MGKLTPAQASFSTKREPVVSRAPYRSRPRSTQPARNPAGDSHRRTLLWIDDYEPGLTVYKALFEGVGFEVLTASRGRTGLALATTNAVDAVIVDYEMPDMTGDAVAAALRALNPGLPVILFSADADLSDKTRRLFDACCEKTMSRDAILATIEAVLARRSAMSLLAGSQMPHSRGFHR